MLGEIVRCLLSMPDKNEYVVLDSNNNKYKIEASSSDQALHEVCRQHKLKEKQCKVGKVR